jgi:hypothetical protein
MSYKLTSGNSVQRLSDGAWIPPDPDNLDYADYQRWLAAGNTPQPVDPEPVAPAGPTLEERVAALEARTR